MKAQFLKNIFFVFLLLASYCVRVYAQSNVTEDFERTTANLTKTGNTSTNTSNPVTWVSNQANTSTGFTTAAGPFSGNSLTFSGTTSTTMSSTLTGSSFSIGSNAWEWSFVYQAPTTFTPSDNNGATVSGNNWRFWVNATGTDPTQSGFIGYYVTQDGNSLKFYQYAFGARSSAIGSFTTTPGSKYIIRVIHASTNGGEWQFYATAYTSSSSFPSTSLGNTFDQIHGTYTCSFFQATLSSTANNALLKWDNLSMYQAGIAIALNSASTNGITRTIVNSGDNVVMFAFSLTASGGITINKLYFNMSSVAFYSGNSVGTLYSSPDASFVDASPVSGAAFNLNATGGVAGFTGMSTFIANSTLYYFVVLNYDNPTGAAAGGTEQLSFSSSASSSFANVVQTTPSASYNVSSNISGPSFTMGITYEWRGGTSTSFTDPNNYRNSNNSGVSSIPGPNDQVRIGVNSTVTTSPTFQPAISGTGTTNIGSLAFGNAFTPSLTINSGATLAVKSGITVNASSSPTITGGTVSLASGSFSTVASTAVLTLGAATTIANNGTFTIKSDASGSGAIGTIPSNSSITGNINVERWITGGAVATYRGYRLMSSPVNISSSTTGTGNIDLGYLNSNIYSIGALTGGPGGTGKGFSVVTATPAIYVYREDVVPGSGTNAGKNKGVTGIYSSGSTSSVDVATGATTATSTNFQLPVGTGFIFYNIGSTAQPGNATSTTSSPTSYAITARGSLNQGTITFKNWYTGASTLSFTSTLTSNKGFNMVGNPYASTIDLHAFYTDNSAVIQSSIYLLNDAGQAYVTYNASNGNLSDPHASQYVASGQGMFVQAISASALTFKETQKAATTQLTGSKLLMSEPVKQAPISGFFMKMAQDSVINDYCGIYFNGASDNFDSNDAVDLDGTAPKVYMSSYTADGQRTAINSLADYKNGKNIRLYVNATTNGLYKLSIEQIANIDAIYDIWLKDNYKKDSLDLRSSNVYNFNVLRTDTASFGAYRFQVVIRRKALPEYQFVSFNGQFTSSGISLKWKTQNEYDFTGFTVEKLGTDKQYSPLYYTLSDGAGAYSYTDPTPVKGINTYRIKQTDIDNNISYSAPVIVNTADADAGNDSFKVYPSPATSLINIQFTNPLTGSANVTIVNSIGDVVNKQVFTQQQGVINISKLKTGVYFIQVLDASTQQKIGLQRFVKL